MRSYKVELDPNNKQRTLFVRYAGAARWAYNYGLKRKIEEYKSSKSSLSTSVISREITELKSSTHLWLNDISRITVTDSLQVVKLVQIVD